MTIIFHDVLCIIGMTLSGGEYIALAYCTWQHAANMLPTC